MKLIKTTSFELAIYLQGNLSASRLALVLPGKLDTKDYAHMRSHVDFLANKGFLAVSFDPPGTWESPGDIELYTMTNYIKAVNELISYFNNRPTFVMGHSRGATITTISGTENENVFAFAPVMSSFAKGCFQRPEDTEWKTKGYHLEKRDLPPGGGEKIKEIKLPYGFFQDQKSYDLTEAITRSFKPKLFILGKHDDLATPETVRQSYKLFAQPKQLYELDCGHDYRLEPERTDEVNRVIGDFLDNLEV